MEEEGGRKRKPFPNDYGFLDTLFSWSLENIFDENFLKSKVEKIPESFESINQYFGSYTYPLLEETRSQLCSSMEAISRAPFTELVNLKACKPHGTVLYDLHVDNWSNRFSNRGKEPHKVLTGDVLILADVKPERVSDLPKIGKNWVFVSVTKNTDQSNGNYSNSTHFEVRAARDIQMFKEMKKSVFLIFLTNITPNRRIWSSLHMRRNLSLIKEVLCKDPLVDGKCELCLSQNGNIWNEGFKQGLSSIFNNSQVDAINACLCRMNCDHKSGVELVWGPPGTGKTKTVCMLLFVLLSMKYRTVICAPTNVAIMEVATRVLKLVKHSFEKDSLFFPLGGILLFGNEEHLKVDSEMKEIFLDYRIERLSECFGKLFGWKTSFTSMIDFLENCVSQYRIFSENELMKENKVTNETATKKKKHRCDVPDQGSQRGCKSFLEYARERFAHVAASLRTCVSIICTHVPISEEIFQDMVSIVRLLDSFKTLLFVDDMVSKDLENLFSRSVCEPLTPSSVKMGYLLQSRYECHSVLKHLWDSLNELGIPKATDKVALRNFCYDNASLIFCTASSSYKLHTVAMKPLKLLVIDEAAQLKESESTIPLQLRGIKHAILIGDELQLSAMVESNISSEAGFGRSLFERLSLLGCLKHLLNIQYRMHPSISFFPKSYIYNNRISDGLYVGSKSYEKSYLPGRMFGPYSFINVLDGREEFEEIGHSCRNMVEVAVVINIVSKLYQAWIVSNRSVCIGVITPYMGQVIAIKEKLGSKYDNINGFVVKVKSVDGFQGGEEDIVIISTVRSNGGGSIGFIANPQRTNVALTRARHCLWILGNERTFIRSDSIWKHLVNDAKRRECFFNADDDKDLAKAILEVKKEFHELDQLLNPESILFRSEKWKVVFSENFLKSFKKLTTVRVQKSIINLLQKLASGCPPKRRKAICVYESSFQMVKQYKVEGLFVICTVDIVKEFQYMQILKIWDILSLEDVPELVKHLDSMFSKYTDDFIKCCNERAFEGNLEVPKTWAITSDIVREKTLDTDGSGNASSDSEGGSSDENSKVNESTLKFYSLSSGVASHLLSDGDSRALEIPFEVTDEEQEIILFPRSTFVLGRSGTGKTTVLIMKLFQKEKLHHLAMQTFHRDEDNTSSSYNVSLEKESAREKKAVLRQLFVTVSPKLCFDVKQHISQLKSSASGEMLPAESTLVDIDDEEQFRNIPNSFVDTPSESFPLVITFRKFLLMLDGTIGTSFFSKFHDLRKYSDGQIQTSSVSVEAFIRTNEVTYNRFASFYWPHFRPQLTEKQDPSRVFTEIISHIKGGLHAMEYENGKLNREDYVSFTGTRVSTLSKSKRERIYGIFENYESMKAERGEFDLSDLVLDLHRRIKDGNYETDAIDFVYIDEVQDLTMSQIALFKYICKNVDEGFVFSGDSAQTIAKGLDFSLQDVKSLFCNNFFMESKKEKGQVSKVFMLSQNFRTHVGVLKLSQSIVDLLYRFFPLSIDILQPEASFINGDVPVLLESCNNEDAIINVFGSSGCGSRTKVGFGAEQVILVRDDIARKEIISHVGKQALVLTILECKGLEFQDVLLCNFFNNSPLKNQWRVIYGYMKEQDSGDSEIPKCPSFNEARHNILCSELKQLYIAITRSKQRLWIWDKNQELSKPMFDYWKKTGLVQVKHMDDSLADDMQVKSCSEEWKLRGIKLFQEQHYESATMCFERAGDTYWERRSKASHLKAVADGLRVSCPQEAKNILKEATQIFEDIGKAISAAKCFYDMGEYGRAGTIYLKKDDDYALQNAAECFYLAGCCKIEADVYVKGNYFSECLNVCSKAKLFDLGLRYIHHRKHRADKDVAFKGSKDIEEIEQAFLETCARHYHELKDTKSMMKFVKAFHSLNSMRNFLRSLNCSDELLAVEEESRNFEESVIIAKQRGDLLLASDLLQKAGSVKEASELVLNHILYNSLWAHGSKGWPLKQFTQKKELLGKAKSLAKQYSEQFYRFVCSEANILSKLQMNVSTLNHQFNDSQRFQSIRGEILSARKILDFHFHSDISNFGCEDDLVSDPITYSKGKFFKNEISIETLICFWHYWKDKILTVFEYLRNFETREVSEYRIYGDFCLDYLGVLKECHNNETIYLLLNSDVDWLRESEHRYPQTDGNLDSVNVLQLVSSAQSYWYEELISVGVKVLEILEAFHKQSINESGSSFCRFSCLVYIYEVAKSLLDSKFLSLRLHDAETLQNFIVPLAEHFFCYIFPLDWRESMRNRNVISLRGTEVCKKMFSEVILRTISGRNKLLSYEQIGKVIVLILGSSRLNRRLYEIVPHWFRVSSPWKPFIERLFCSSDGENMLRDVLVVKKFHEALEDTYGVDWKKEKNYISASCFLYLIERLLVLLCCFQGYILTTKSSFTEWLINTSFSLTDWKDSAEDLHVFSVRILGWLLVNIKDTFEWIKNSPIENDSSLVVLRLFVILCLLHMNFGVGSDLLSDMMAFSYVTDQLPQKFYDILCHNFLNMNVIMIAGAFETIGNPLVVVSLGENCSKFLCPGAIFVDMKVEKCKEDILGILFPTITTSKEATDSSKVEVYPQFDDQAKSSNLSSSRCLQQDQVLSTRNIEKDNPEMSLGQVLKINESLKLVEDGYNQKSFVSNAPSIKVDKDESIKVLTCAMEGCCIDGEDKKNEGDEATQMLEEHKQPHSAIYKSVAKGDDDISAVVGGLCKSSKLRKPKLESFHDQESRLCRIENSKKVNEVLLTKYACGTEISDKETGEEGSSGKSKSKRKRRRKKRGKAGLIV